MGMHLLSSKALVFVAGVAAGQLFKSGFINSMANKFLDSVEGVLSSSPATKIRNAKAEEKKTTKKPTAKV
jgi:hypothetical protein